MKIVSNSSVLISLSSIGRLSILKNNFEKIFIPHAVWDEVVIHGKGEPGAGKVRNANWIEIKKVKNTNLISALNETLDLGEAEAIALSLELSADLILLDEKDARLISVKYGIKPLGTVGILIREKRKGRIVSLRKELDRLINEGNFRISTDIYNLALKEVGE